MSVSHDATVTHCICTGQSFAQLLERARAEGWNLQELRDATGAAEHCESCLPYLARMMRTGETRFVPMTLGGFEV